MTDDPLPAGEAGGDPACWADRVCPSCGRFVEGDPPEQCPRCGELLLHGDG